MFRLVGAVLLAALLGACASPFKSEFNAPDGKTLLVSKRDWNDFQEYLGKVGSTRDGAFAMGVYQGQSDGWASSSCPVDACYGGKASANAAMGYCREGGGECVLFAINTRVLVNYEVMEE
jgi:hypothetical protein